MRMFHLISPSAASTMNKSCNGDGTTTFSHGHGLGGESTSKSNTQALLLILLHGLHLHNVASRVREVARFLGPPELLPSE
jgi:hypothetical protein